MLDTLSLAARIGTRIVRAVSICLALLMLVFAGYSILDSYYIERAAFASWDLVQYRPINDRGETSAEQFNAIRSINSDVVGWITIFDTHIDYPVLQGPDNLYYVNRDLHKEASISGSIYLQTENRSDFQDSFNLLYGHHFDNGAMFGDVANYTDVNYLREHQYGQLITPQGVYRLKIFMCIETDAYDDSIYGRTNLENAENMTLYSAHKYLHIDPDSDLIEEAPYDEFNFGGHGWVIAMSTCDDAMTDGRTVVVADVSLDKTALDTKDTNIENNPVVEVANKALDKWAILNLICLILTFLCIVPYIVRFLPDREEEKKLREILGAVLVVIVAGVSLILFVSTENLKLQVTIRDQFTPWMIFLFAAALLSTALVDRRKRKKRQQKEETVP